jgi:hypothetical protein
MFRILTPGLVVSCCIIASAFAQQEIEITFIQESIEAVSKSTELLTFDPLTTTLATTTPTEILKPEQAGTPETAGEPEPIPEPSPFSICVETHFSENTNAITVPVSYSPKKPKNLTLSVLVPFFFKREIDFSQETKDAYGLGDIAVRGAYALSKWNWNYEASLIAKLPTGDADNTEDGYLVPLGTGSFDFIMCLTAVKPYENFSLSANATFRINGSGSKTVAVVHPDEGTETIDYDITNGTHLTLSGLAAYFLREDLTLSGILSLSIVGEGTTDRSHSYSWDEPGYDASDISNEQDMTYMDFSPAVTFHHKGIDYTFLYKIPLLTRRNSNNEEGSRGGALIFKIGFDPKSLIPSSSDEG